MEEFGGIPPYRNVYRNYELEHVFSKNGYAFWFANESIENNYDSLALPVLGLKYFSNDQEEKSNQLKPFWDALASLENAGFLYECVTAMDGTGIDQDTRPLYDIVTRPKHGHPLKGEEGLLKKISGIFKKLEIECADNAGRFNGKYPVISLVGVNLQVIGIYRLRFRLTNPKNYPVKAGWIRIQNDRDEWIEHFEQLEKVLDIHSEI